MPWLFLLLSPKDHTLQDVLKQRWKPHPSQSKIQLLQKSARFDLLKCSLRQPQGTDFYSSLAFSRYRTWLCGCLSFAVQSAWSSAVQATANYAICFMAFQCEAAPLRIQQEPRCPPSPYKRSRCRAIISAGAEGPSLARARHAALCWGLWSQVRCLAPYRHVPTNTFLGKALSRRSRLFLEHRVCLTQHRDVFLGSIRMLKNTAWKRLNPPDPALHQGISEGDESGNVWAMLWAGYTPYVWFLPSPRNYVVFFSLRYFPLNL